MNKQYKLEAWAERELQRNISKLILDDDDGGYIVFGKYRISPRDSFYLVETWDREIHSFSSKRNAMSWCIADHKNHIVLAARILNLDKKRQLLQNDVGCRMGIRERSRSQDFYETVLAKIQPKLDSINMLNQELEKCVNSAKYLQIKGFLNETARTGRD